jgi:hypothetical protein
MFDTQEGRTHPSSLGEYLFFEMGAKALPHLLIKKKRIVQLINRKLSEDRYNNTTNNAESFDQQDNQQALPTYNNHKLTTQRTPHHK